tara:strand:+ start:3772 stop:3984 length:213 start_codon:yes stop_codon:yes gene_type:complete
MYTPDTKPIYLSRQTLENAQKWYKVHDIPVYYFNAKLYYNTGDFELELSKDEVIYRAKEYTRLKNNNLIK